MRTRIVTYRDVLMATLVGPEEVNRVSLALVLRQLQVGRGDTLALAACTSEQHEELIQAIRSRQLDCVRLWGQWKRPEIGTERFIVVRSERQVAEPLFQRSGRRPFVYWEVGSRMADLVADDEEREVPLNDPGDLARLVGDAKGVIGFFFRSTTADFIEGLQQEKFEKFLRRSGRKSDSATGLALLGGAPAWDAQSGMCWPGRRQVAYRPGPIEEAMNRAYADLESR